MKTYLNRVPAFTFIISILLLFGVCKAEEIIPPDSDCNIFSVYRKPPYPACEPVVMVIRHAEDVDLADGSHVLSESGKIHALLYPQLFQKYIEKSHIYDVEKCACEIDKIIAINPSTNNSNDNPSSNPYETIKPLSSDINFSNIPIVDSKTGSRITIVDVENVAYGSNYEWTLKRRLALLNPDHQHSTAIVWDKQGLNASDTDIKKAANYGQTPHLGQADKIRAGEDAVGASLLEALPVLFPVPLSWKGICPENGKQPDTCFFLPGRNDFYVLSDQGEDGKFKRTKFYQQLYSDKANAPDDDLSWYRSAKLADTQKPLSIKIKKY